MAYRMHTFESRTALAEAMADRVAAQLSAAIAARGTASLAVSGGSTPGPFFETLATRDIGWDKVTITLVDERFVPADHPRSNHLLVATHLLKSKASVARFIPLYHATENVEEAASLATQETAALGAPLDVVILGMGLDGHTASFFPGGDRLEGALDHTGPRRVMTMKAEGAGETRLTFSYPTLADARLLLLHIEGAEKKAVLDQAIAGTDVHAMPIRAILNGAPSTPDIYWAP
ncbi:MULTISPECIES: 6-phosphogluconolactonase [Alphaproteobacteria]|uniref:6-phosphogluconolactonase n=2 Tax=Alphaproteobacteria TaxID=28211 RepID=A0A512HID1_9HYPH|nr:MULTISPECIES: 6-phosphogluconolactonase [Alphaproteobacteria]GEO85215.1 6-phosphogluconolactonase [Ciceribacter naphthalenivorans]GLR24451.1 6-phosphogluconolactonase [Ciceribacter naphthalenivorans]GLT07307.1 6-phosphogluconolactonase [Sphingomonas psychrolutea]